MSCIFLYLSTHSRQDAISSIQQKLSPFQIVCLIKFSNKSVILSKNYSFLGFLISAPSVKKSVSIILTLLTSLGLLGLETQELRQALLQQRQNIVISVLRCDVYCFERCVDLLLVFTLICCTLSSVFISSLLIISIRVIMVCWRSLAKQQLECTTELVVGVF